jgi:hypothetical protein
MTQIIKQNGKFLISMLKGHTYYAFVHSDTAEWHCFNIRKKGTYKITCNGEDDYTIVEKDPPPKTKEETPDK